MNVTETADTTVNTATDTTVNAVPNATVPATAPVVAALVEAKPAVPKAPSKKSQADVIFAVRMIERKEGLFASNKEFRAAVLKQIQDDLGVSVASAATMYNSAKKAAEAEDATVALGRDPKKEKPAKGEGKRGRPAGSKNKAKEVDPNAPPAADAAPATDAVATNEVVVNADPVVEAAVEAVQPAEAAA